jgi:hypothetical protein
MQQNERSASREVEMVHFLTMVYYSIIERGIDETIPEEKNDFIKVWLGEKIPQIIRWLALIETLLE